MRIIPKLQNTWTTLLADNTRILKPIVMYPVKRVLKPGEQFFDNNGKTIIVSPRLEYVYQDNRDSKIQELSHKESVKKRKKKLLKKAQENTTEVFGNILEESTLVPTFERITGEELTPEAKFAASFVLPTATFKGMLLVGKGLNYAGKAANYVARMGMPALGYAPSTRYYFKPGYLGANSGPIGKVPEVPEGYTFIRELMLNGQLKHIVKDPNGKFKVLEDLDLNNVRLPIVNLKNYNGEKLTGNEPGFDEWARTRIPENDHFPDLSHGMNDIRDLLPLMNREFESLPNGSRVDLGHIFSSDSSSNLLQFIRRNHKRIKVVLPKSYDEMVITNDHGIRGADSERIFNEQLDKILDLYGYSPNAVPRAKYDPNTNTLRVPKLSFLKLYKKGNKIKWN